MNKITDNIFLGNATDARDAEALKANGITAILNVAIDLDYFPPTGIAYFKVGMTDGKNNPNGMYLNAVATLKSLLGRYKVLVHCHEGRSRSPSVVAGCLRRTDQLFEDALGDLNKIRDKVNPEAGMIEYAKGELGL
jgi:protein-tyrosine phosphatase